MKNLLLAGLMLLLTGCSIVQWLPSSACEYVRYERVGDQVNIAADCRL